MNFIENNLFNQIKMSKKFVWNLKTLSVSSLFSTTCPSIIIKVSILLVLPPAPSSQLFTPGVAEPRQLSASQELAAAWAVGSSTQLIIQTNYRPFGPG